MNKWKNTRKSETSLRETNEYDQISDEEIDSDDTQVTSAEEDEEDIPDLDDMIGCYSTKVVKIVQAWL